ncbi:MAG: septal ring lytic transglycosylase RlpA family protein [Bacteroidota bacterium]
MTTRVFRIVLAVLVFIVAGCAGGSPRFTSRDRTTPATKNFEQEGMASYYADEFHGRKTANGEVYDMNSMTAAHQTLPFNSLVKVTNLENGRTATVRINDRGPFKDNRILDLSLAAAKKLGIIVNGTAQVKIQILELGE